MKFAEKLRQLTADENKAKLSRAAGLPPNAINDYINKGHRPGIDNALALARTLKVPLEWLVDDAADWPPPEDRVAVWDNYGMMQLPVFTLAPGPRQLPPAKEHQFKMAVVSDAPPGKAPMVASDATGWKFSDGSTVPISEGVTHAGEIRSVTSKSTFPVPHKKPH